MIPSKIQTLFDFIDYLDSNKNGFIDKYVPVCTELQGLFEQKFKLNEDNNYLERQKSNEIQNQINEKLESIKSNIYNPILKKLRELRIWSGDETYASLWNLNIEAIYEFKINFDLNDIPIILNYKTKYLSFRKETGTDFLYLKIAFNRLDEILKVLFDYFKDTDDNEFRDFEAETIVANNIHELAKGIHSNLNKNVKFLIQMNNSNSQENSNEIMGPTHSLKNEIIMGNKTQVQDISYNSGSVSISKANSSNENAPQPLAQKSFNWQKWGIIVTTVLTIIAIIISILK